MRDEKPGTLTPRPHTPGRFGGNSSLTKRGSLTTLQGYERLAQRRNMFRRGPGPESFIAYRRDIRVVIPTDGFM